MTQENRANAQTTASQSRPEAQGVVPIEAAAAVVCDICREYPGTAYLTKHGNWVHKIPDRDRDPYHLSCKAGDIRALSPAASTPSREADAGRLYYVALSAVLSCSPNGKLRDGDAERIRKVIEAAQSGGEDRRKSRTDEPSIGRRLTDRI